jgi:hypothetical protein
MVNPGKVKQLTMPVQLRVLDGHVELNQLHLVDSLELPLVLGHLWLSTHNPQIAWPSGRVLVWNPSCQFTCQQLSPHLSSPACLETSDPPIPLDGNDKPDLSHVPWDSLDLGQVFSKQGASKLPPHRPYDSAIGLLTVTTPLRRGLYSLSGSETAAMNSYIKEALAADFIPPSTSPAGAGFFFCWEEGWGITSLYRFLGFK